MNTQELFNHYYVQALANICEGDQAKMAHVLQVKQAAEAAPVAPAAEGGSLIPGVDNSMLYSALAGAGIGGIGGAALSKKNKLRNALIAAIGGAGVGVGGKMLYDKLMAGPDKEKSEHAGMMSNTGSPYMYNGKLIPGNKSPMGAQNDENFQEGQKRTAGTPGTPAKQKEAPAVDPEKAKAIAAQIAAEQQKIRQRAAKNIRANKGIEPQSGAGFYSALNAAGAARKGLVDGTSNSIASALALGKSLVGTGYDNYTAAAESDYNPLKQLAYGYNTLFGSGPREQEQAAQYDAQNAQVAALMKQFGR